MNPAILIGAAAVLAISLGKKRGRASKKLAIVCPYLSFGTGSFAGYDYIEFTTGGADPNDRLPIVFFLHGRGGSPELFAEHVKNIPSRARIVLPRGHLGTRSNPIWFELRAATEDQETLAAQMYREAQSLSRFIEEANYCLKGRGKPVVAGHSQGGMMTLALAAAVPDSIRAAVAASGWLPTPLWPRRLPATVLVHGMNDDTVDYDRTADFAERAKSAGLSIDLVPIKNHGHGFSGDLEKSWLNTIDQLLR